MSGVVSDLQKAVGDALGLRSRVEEVSSSLLSANMVGALVVAASICFVGRFLCNSIDQLQREIRDGRRDG